MKLELVLSKADIERQLPYALICETRYGSRWNTLQRKRRWTSEFTEVERKAASRIFAQCHTWYLVKGTPDEVKMSMSTYGLWEKLAGFCYSL